MDKVASFRRFLISQGEIALSRSSDQTLHEALSATKPLPGQTVTLGHGPAVEKARDGLDRLGGELPQIDPAMLKRADFVTYPKRIKEGSNCSSCRHNQNVRGQHQCTFHDEAKGIDLRGQPVNERNCCGEWDAPGTLRSWESGTVTKGWDSSKHPRGGHPENPGEFSSGQGATKPAGQDGYPAFPGAPGANSPAPDSPTRNTAELRRPRPADYARATPTAHRTPSAADRSPIHRALEGERMKHAKNLSSGANEAYLLTLEDGTQGIFKPQSGENPHIRDGVPSKTGYLREVAASRIAEILGFNDLVPTTTFRQQEGHGVGSMQAYVADAPDAADIDKKERFDGKEDAARAAVFDYLLGHLDRHQGNWLVKDNKLVLIDNGTSLPTDYNDSDLFNMEFWRHATKHELELPDLSNWKDKWDAIEKELKDCGIEESAIKLTRQRFHVLVNAESSRFSDLPSLFDGWNMGETVNAYDWGARIAAMGSKVPEQWRKEVENRS